MIPAKATWSEQLWVSDHLSHSWVPDVLCLHYQLDKIQMISQAGNRSVSHTMHISCKVSSERGLFPMRGHQRGFLLLRRTVNLFPVPKGWKSWVSPKNWQDSIDDTYDGLYLTYLWDKLSQDLKGCCSRMIFAIGLDFGHVESSCRAESFL